MVKILKGKGHKISKKVAKEELNYSLPTEKSIPSSSLQDYSILIYGRKKIGKSSLTAQFDRMLGLMCEPGGKAQSMYQAPCRDWKELRAKTRLFIEDKRFQTASIDTADFAYEFCMDYVCTKMVMDHPSDEGYGKGWKAVRTEFTDWVNELLHSGKGVIFISHIKDEEIKNRKNESRHRAGSSMSGQASDILEGLVDIWGCYDYNGKERVLIIGGSDELDAGHRCEGRFKYEDGSDIETIPMGNSAKKGYENFIAAFENRLKKEKQKISLKIKAKTK